jgi:hypothetical protein
MWGQRDVPDIMVYVLKFLVIVYLRALSVIQITYIASNDKEISE